MVDDAEQRASTFYNEAGWETAEGLTEDARRWEDLRLYARAYVSKCRLRVLRHIPESGDYILDMASGPIQYREYLEYSKHFKKRYCVDLSHKALEDARAKIGDHGVFLAGSFFDLPLEDDFFDCTISLHTLFHIDKDRQEEAVRKMVRVTKPGGPVIIVYGNPHALSTLFTFPYRMIRKIGRVLRKAKVRPRPADEPDLYYFTHPISWWKRFADVAEVRVLPWRSLGSDHQKLLFPDTKFGARMFSLLFSLEDRFPRVFAKLAQYPMVILTKK